MKCRPRAVVTNLWHGCHATKCAQDRSGDSLAHAFLSGVPLNTVEGTSELASEGLAVSL